MHFVIGTVRFAFGTLIVLSLTRAIRAFRSINSCNRFFYDPCKLHNSCNSCNSCIPVIRVVHSSNNI
jgi:hypothetical protein